MTRQPGMLEAYITTANPYRTSGLVRLHAGFLTFCALRSPERVPQAQYSMMKTYIRHKQPKE